jgi:hypothetical protein
MNRLSSNDIREKNAAIIELQQAIGSGIANRAPSAVISQEAKTVGGPSISPDASFEIAAQKRAIIQQYSNFYSDWEKNKSKINNPSSYINDWFAEHPSSNYMDAAAQKMPMYAGMSEAMAMKYARHILPGETEDQFRSRLANESPQTFFVAPSGPLKGKTLRWKPNETPKPPGRP